MERFARINPRRIRLNGPAGQPLSQRVTIIPEDKYPFKITGTRLSQEGNIKVAVEPKTDGDRPAYVVTIENLKNYKGRYFTTVYIETDSEVKPEIRLPVYGNIFENVLKGDDGTSGSRDPKAKG